jgi:ABC-type nitrate/sulfonate/bicarbonate transport system permease component
MAEGRKRRFERLYPVLGVVALLAVWSLIYVLKLVPTYSLPAPWNVAKAMVDNANSMLPDVWVTAKELMLGVAISIVAGLTIGVAIADSKVISRVVYPMVVASQVVPKVALGPVILLWFGFGLFSNAMVGALIGFFPAVLGTIVGLRGVEVEKLQLARSMGAGYLKTLFRIRIPAASPMIMAGVRLATIYAVSGVIVGEFIGGNQGIGRRILEASAAFSTENAFAATGYVVIMGLIAFGIVAAIDARVTRWHSSRRKSMIG